MFQDRPVSRDVNKTKQINLRYMKHVIIRSNILWVWMNVLGKLVLMTNICSWSKALISLEVGSSQIRHIIKVDRTYICCNCTLQFANIHGILDTFIYVHISMSVSIASHWMPITIVCLLLSIAWLSLRSLSPTGLYRWLSHSCIWNLLSCHLLILHVFLDVSKELLNGI